MTKQPLSPRRYFISLAGCVVFTAGLLAISPGVGTEFESFSWWDAWRSKLGIVIPMEELADKPLVDLDQDGSISQEEAQQFTTTASRIGFEHRLPRSLLALQVGITLALCGAVFQVLFRNPLATPYTLGIASGGSLSALIAIRVGWTATVFGISSLTISAMAGSLLVVALVILIARSTKRLTSNEMLLAGVTLGLFCSAMMMLVTAISTERQTFVMIRWMMGSLDPVAAIQRVINWPILVPAWLVLVLMSRSLNQYRMGEEIAATRGVNIVRLQMVCVLLCSLITAIVVAQCGPIGFVGLVVPHVATLLFGSDCRLTLPISALIGGSFLIICDWLSQISMTIGGWLLGKQLGSATLPVGVITAVIGVPIFLTLLHRRQN